MDIGRGIYFVTGIDTDCGKTYATAYLACLAAGDGLSVITQKFVQTGCDSSEISEDIVTHRRLQGIDFHPEDLDHTTCPLIFRLPSSPHLAAEQQGVEIDVSIIDHSTHILSKRYDVVFIEGAGGLLVPITSKYLTADYLADRNIPLILVATAKLGSLNHTLLSLEYIRRRGLLLAAVVYNTYISTNQVITADTGSYIKKYLSEHFSEASFIEMCDFSGTFCGT